MLPYFKSNIKKKVAPRKSECLKFKQKFLDLFNEKTWLQIKFIYNTYKTI